MTKQVQLIGHAGDSANEFVGADREITVDTSNRELRLHDGATPGGRRILDRDANDERYQGKSGELDGFGGWNPNQVGFLTRLGPADYRLRTLVVNNEFVIDNADGVDGNPTLSLASVIAKDITFEGIIEFDQAISAPSFTGMTNGTHTGNVVGDVTGDVTGDAQGNHGGTFTGSIDISGGMDFIADDGQIPASYIGGLDAALANLAFPAGGIIMWSGIVADIPDGWHLCDGSAGTPDLRNRFIIAAGLDYDPLTTGGSDEHTHIVDIEEDGSHSHTGDVGDTVLTIAQIPNHKHGNGVTDQASGLFNHGSLAANPTTADSIENNGSTGTLEGYTTSVGGGEAHDHGLSVNASGTHTHAVSVETVSHIPSYYALCFIMKGA